MDVLEHPLVVALLQIILAGSVSYFLTERWQRWRQRREFQNRSMVKFSELSEEAFSRLSELLMSRGRIPDDQHNRLRREHIYRRGPLLAMDGELSVTFKDVEIFRGLLYLRDIMRILYDMACAPKPVSQEQFEPVQNCMAAQRKLMITIMAGEMGFFSRREVKKALEELEPKAKLPPDVAM
jgi:hypothetical protein